MIIANEKKTKQNKTKQLEKHCQRILIRITVIEDLTVKAEDKNMFC